MGSIFVGLSAVAVSAAAQEKGTLTLEAALVQAFDRHPEIGKMRSAVAVRQALLRGAGVFPFNPVLSADANTRMGEGTTLDFTVGLSQEFEIAGQRGHRKASAGADVDTSILLLERAEREIAAEVRWSFVHAAAQRQLLEIARSELELSGQLVDLARRRLEAGAGTQLEVVVAGAELSKAEEQLNTAAGEYAIARAELGYAVGLGPEALPEPVGSPAEAPLSVDLASLIASARENRRDLLAFRQSEIAAQRRLDLARSEAWPNLTIGIFAGQEASSEVLVGGGIEVPLPLFARNQGAIAVATAEADEAQSTTIAAEQAVLRDVATAFEQYLAAQKSLASLRKNVSGTEEALELLRRSFETGKNSWVEILVMRRSLFDAERALVKVAESAHRARIKLDVATGTTLTNPRQGTP